MERSKPGLSHRQKQLQLLFCNRAPKAYFSELNEIFGYQLGLLLSQLAYWEGKEADPNGWIYITEEQLRKQTGLTSANQKYAIRRGKDLGLLELTYRQVPRKRHYRVLWTRVYETIEIEAPKHGIKLSRKLMELVDNHPTITKSTQQTTAKTDSSGGNIRKTLSERYASIRRALSDRRKKHGS